MGTYAKLPCKCGSRRFYWEQVGWDGFDAVSQPFCGDCRRLLDTYEEWDSSDTQNAIWWVIGGAGFLIGFVALMIAMAM
jgi:hypothetical protein